MATVPVYENFKVQPGGPSGARNTAPEMPDIAGTQARQLGAGLTNAGGAAAKYAMDMATQVNETRVMDAVNKAKERQFDMTYNAETGFAMQKGINALERESGKGLSEEYGEKFNSAMQEISAGLGNEVQRTAFNRQAGQMGSQMHGNMQRHMAQEFNSYQGTVFDGQIAASQRELTSGYGDTGPGGVVATSVQGIEAAVRGKARLMGQSQLAADEMVIAATSKAHVLAVKTALERNDVSVADDYLKRYGAQMEAGDLLSVRASVTKEMDVRQADVAATHAVANVVPRVMNGDGDRVINITMQSESGGRRYADSGYGKRADGSAKGEGFLGALKRPDGALSTEITVGVNIGGKEMDIPSLVPTLTKAEISSLLNGDKPSNTIVQKAVDHAKSRLASGKSVFADQRLLTSSAGAKGEMQVMDGTNKDPGFGVKPAQDNSPDERARVGRDYMNALIKHYDGNLGHAWAAYNGGPGALDKAIKLANARPGGDYLTFMPAETQDYVTKNLKAYNAGSGGFSAPTIADVHAQIRTELGANTRPEVMRMALASGTQQFAELTAAKKSKDDESDANAMRALVQNGGRWSQLSASQRGSIRPEKVDDMLNFAGRIAKGDDVTNPALFLKLTNNPELLGQMSDNAFYAARTELSASDFESFAKQRKDQITGGTGKGWADLNTQAVKLAMHSRLTALKIDPSPKEDGGSDARRVGAMQMFVAKELREAQRLAGKQFNEAETSKFVDGLFAFSTSFKTSFLGMGTGTKTQTMLSMKPGDVPSDMRAMLKKDFANRGIDATPEDILGAYFRMKRAQAKPSTGGASGDY